MSLLKHKRARCLLVALLSLTGVFALQLGHGGFFVPAGVRVALLHAAGGPVADDTGAIQEAESTVRSLRAKKAVLSRREEILRYELAKLEEERRRSGAAVNARLVDDMRKSRNMLVLLLRDQQEADKKVTEYLKQMWEAEGRVRVATMGMDPSSITVLLSWPIAPEEGISASFKDREYEELFGLEHNAIDIPVEQGSAIHAAADGVVEAVVDNGMGYNYLILMHDGYATLYGHVLSFLVEPGQAVEAGDTVALSGGRPDTPGAGEISTGPHVHFEVILGGEHVDPLAYLPFIPGLQVAGVQE